MSQPPYPPPGGSDAGGDPPGPEYGQQAPQYGQPQYGQAQYAPRQYGQQYPYGGAGPDVPPGHPPPGQYAAPGYPTAQYGSPGYLPPGQYAPPPWGGAGGSAPRSSSRKLVIGIVAGAALLAVVLAVALFVGVRGDDGAGIPEAASEPVNLGEDADLDDLAEECHDGAMQACDDLFRYAPRWSAYQLYGGTCAGRQPNADARAVFCTDAFPGED
ncbi:hypothetical protein [Blastococcus sp. CCUG 61487]|uniref:hypothetical protein n=1 Tax=Blastococcus sp. CCUG 61487 TaxID=1840703 RepID=UPI0010C10AEB|nr:hypothetical protein [Blastococcus sp. CCUG 61487]TKJ21503.1 hypothetical protein A6V29_07385 [Blastococcus sp. CCUG 61487]